MKKSTKIILPALAVLVLGTAAAATGTVAWFAANGVVSATGMQVKCATSKNLLITNFDPSTAQPGAWVEGDNYGTAVKSTNNVQRTLSPSSTTANELKTPSFYYVEKAIGAVKGEIKSGAVIKKVNAETQTNAYYAEHNFWIANSATENMSIAFNSLTISMTDKDGDAVTTSKGITKALRVAFVYQDRTTNDTTYVVKIFSVVDGATTSYQGLKGVTTTGVTESTAAGVKEGDTALSEAVSAPLYSDDSTSKALGTIKSTTSAVAAEKDYVWSTLKAYVWYEGQDANCTSNNALSVENVSLSFSLIADDIGD